MKTTVNLLLLIPLFSTIISCSNNRSADEILDDPEQQDEVLTAIANDSTLLAKLHDKIPLDGEMNMEGSHSMMRSCMAMMDNPKMMNMMMDNPGMMNMMIDNMMMRCEEDSATCMMMCDKMMNSENMRRMMQDRMKGMDMRRDN